jgi:ABC-2 type transport system ATP-binding protein
VVLARGRVLKAGTVAELRAGTGLRSVRLGATELPELPEVEALVRNGDGSWLIPTRDVDAVVRALVGAGVPLADLEVTAMPLEETFLELTRGQADQ